MTNAVDAAIAAAKQKADEAPSQEVAVAQPQATAVVPAGQTFGLDDLTTGGSADVDDWLKVSEAGLRVGSEPSAYFEEFEAILDTSEVQRCNVVKFGNPATYLKTYDGVTCAEGGTWADALHKASQIPGPDGKPPREYPSANLALEVAEDIEAKKKIVAKAGTILGHSLSTTNWNNFKNVMKQLKEQDKLGATVKLKVGYEVRTNKNNNEWGILTFELVEILD